MAQLIGAIKMDDADLESDERLSIWGLGEIQKKINIVENEDYDIR